MILGFLSHPAYPSTLQGQAAALRQKAIANVGKISSLQYQLTVASSLGGTPVSTGEGVVWSRTAQKLKRSRTVGPTAIAIADVPNRTLLSQEGSVTLLQDALSDDRLDPYRAPMPGWIWEPDVFLPAIPTAIAQDGTALVVTAGGNAPQRKIWLDATTGCILRFTDTDASGRAFRTVNVSGWTQQGGVWVPQQITEQISGTAKSLTRTLTFSEYVVNATLQADAFALP